MAEVFTQQSAPISLFVLEKSMKYTEIDETVIILTVVTYSIISSMPTLLSMPA
jgi:hypothetical protein